MQRAGDGSAGGGGVTAPGPKSLLGISCWDGSAPSPRKLPDPWPTKLSPNPHRVPTILVAGRDLPQWLQPLLVLRCGPRSQSGGGLV